MKYLLSLIIFGMCTNSFAQNMVNFPSFETRTGEPTSAAQLNLCTGWTENFGYSADYKTSLGTGSGEVTTNATDCLYLPDWGGRNECGPLFDGTAIIGTYVNTFNNPDARENFHGTMTQMSIGTDYDVSFALRNINNYNYENSHCTDKWGIMFSTGNLSGFDMRNQSAAWWSAYDQGVINTVVEHWDWVEYSWTITATALNDNVTLGIIGTNGTVNYTHWDGSGGLGGYYWYDDVVVTEVVPLAEEEIEIIAEVLSKEAIEVRWEPSYINVDSRYDLLRSSDGGKTFITIDKVEGNELEEFISIDQNPGTEKVFYKVREIQENTRKSSKAVSLTNPYVSRGIEWIVQNVSNGVFNVGLVAQEIGKKKFRIYDLKGRLIYEESIKLLEGRNDFSFSIEGLRTGVYVCSLDGVSQKKIFIEKD